MTREIGVFNTIQASAFDEKTGMMLTNQNLVWLQNLRAQYGHELVNLELDVNNPLPYAIAKASLQGQIALIGYIMDCDKAARAADSDPNQE